MAYVNMTKDFSEVRKTLPGTNLTKRQLAAFIIGVIVGLPVFLVMRFMLQRDVMESVTGLAVVTAPIVLCLLYKKHGFGIEKYLYYFYETHFVRNTDRTYKTNNLYVLHEKEKILEKEVERILFAGKSRKEIAEIKAAGESSEIKVGKRHITVPMKGPIDPKVKRELEKAVRKAKIKGDIPESAQDTIPYRVPYEDGIFESEAGYYTQTIAFEDITYQLLDNDPKNILFERWCTLINYFSPEIHFQFNYGNMEMDKDEYAKDFVIAPQEDGHNIVRKEYSDMLVKQFEKGTNNLKKERYLTYGICEKSYKSAKLRLAKISKQLEKYLHKFNSRCRVLNGYERLELLFRIFHPATKEKLLWNWDMPVKSGLSSKDFIAPSSFSFKSGRI